MVAIDKLRVGTRGSPLALTQTNQIISILKKNHAVLKERSGPSIQAMAPESETMLSPDSRLRSSRL